MSADSAAATTEVVVHAQTRASDRALLLELRAAGGGQLPAAEPGGHVDLHLGRLIRQYSLVDVGMTDRYLVCVQYEPEGSGGSRYVHQQVRVGDRLRVSAPRNTFGLDVGSHHAVLVAGGIGVTPLLAMAGALEARGASYELHLYARGEAPLREYIESQPYRDRVSFHDTSSGSSLRSGGRPAWTLSPDDTIVYACGPSGFLEAVTGYASAAGIAAEAIRSERFTVEQPADLGGDAFTVVAASTGQRMVVGDGETIAEVLERNGYEVVLSCEQGICGSCLTGVCDGIPDHRDEVQSAAEHAASTQINICVSASRSAVITLNI